MVNRSWENLAYWLGIAGAVYFLLVVLQGFLAGSGYTIFTTDFTLSGTFGDSFGGISAFMATAAAIGAWTAVNDQRSALNQANDREKELREADSRRDFETTYFNLLNTLERIVSQIDVGRFWSRRTAKDPFSFFVESVDHKREKLPLEESYNRIFDEYKNDLSHYFRTLFNIIVFVKTKRDKDCYFYIKLLRATLSEPELILIALNCLYHPEGEKFFKPLIEDFALLNNISDSAKADYDLTDSDRGYKESAFGRIMEV